MSDSEREDVAERFARAFNLKSGVWGFDRTMDPRPDGTLRSWGHYFPKITDSFSNHMSFVGWVAWVVVSTERPAGWGWRRAFVKAVMDRASRDPGLGPWRPDYAVAAMLVALDEARIANEAQAALERGT